MGKQKKINHDSRSLSKKLKNQIPAKEKGGAASTGETQQASLDAKKKAKGKSWSKPEIGPAGKMGHERSQTCNSWGEATKLVITGGGEKKIRLWVAKQKSSLKRERQAESRKRSDQQKKRRRRVAEVWAKKG